MASSGAVTAVTAVKKKVVTTAPAVAPAAIHANKAAPTPAAKAIPANPSTVVSQPVEKAVKKKVANSPSTAVATKTKIASSAPTYAPSIFDPAGVYS